MRLTDLALLVRAPAALSVPGDVIAGAAAAGRPLGARTLGVIGSSVCLYWAGMALNDYADAAVDSVERPGRPVPSGRVPRRTALAVAGTLTAAGIGLAAASGGRRSVGVALPLAGLVWAYDLKLKSTPAGGFAMAGARVLDVLAGAVVPGAGAEAVGVALRRAAVPAGVVGVHTGTLMALSRHEVGGAPVRVPSATFAVSAVTALAAAVPVEQGAIRGAAKGRRASAAPSGLVAQFPAPLKAVVGAVSSKKLPAVVAAVGALGYLGTYGSAQVRAVRRPSGENVRRAVGAGILGLMPLQAALTARGGAPGVAAALGVIHPLARRLARRISPT
ncbi:SCO3242 family prenyltransferase [Streptomyces muensis]|uniref:UbiA family prenyltransferase n=1 Tax=Streptomyces muensis TaxID=1077944 RepID=A0A9X1Q015_STRM4|nr:UbiA family prenyltransferase [Streptomyces muensis]MCF1596086.1 UbiA family prenyltransferase [Streptomyces muensis]